MPISFPVSTKSVLRCQIRDRVDEAVIRHGLDPAGLSLRLTDIGVPVAGRPDLLASFHELTQRGITLELDDVGRGDGSIGNLLSLPISTVRLDRSIIDAMCASQPHAAVVASIAGLCRSLGQTVLAVGVSDARRVEALEAMGVTTVRLGEPVPLRQASTRPSP